MPASKNIQDLQIKVAFLEDTLSKVSDEYYQQQRDIENLKRQYKALLEKLDLASSSDAQALSLIHI